MRKAAWLLGVLAAGCATSSQGLDPREAARIRENADRAFAAPEMNQASQPTREAPARPAAPPPAPVASGRPDWISGRSATYDDAHYMIGVGFALERGAAENAAFAALARIFKAQVDSQLRDNEQSIASFNSKSGGAHAEVQNVEQQTRVSTQKAISGATVAEAWTDPDSKQTYALAVLERQVAAKALIDEIAGLDAKIQAETQLAEASKSGTERFFHLARALEASKARDALNAELRIVDPRGSGVVAGSGPDLAAKLANALANTRMGLEVGGEQAPRVQRCLADALTAEGFMLAESGAMEGIFRAKVGIQEAGQIGVSRMARVELSVDLIDVASQRVLRSAQADTKVGRPDWAATLGLAGTRLCDELVPQVVAALKKAKP